MARLSRDNKRDQRPAADPAAPAAAPIDIHVPASGPGAGAAWAGGVRIAPAPGEEVQQAVLTHLHHLALTTGHPVLATIHDERIGYVVPLQVNPDGASRFTTDPMQMAPPGERGPTGAEPDRRDDTRAPAQTPGAPHATSGVPTPPDVPASPAFSEAPTDPAEPQQPHRDLPTHLLRPVADETAPSFTLRALPESRAGHAPGTVAPPTGAFGPPPVMDAPPEPVRPVRSPDPVRPASPLFPDPSPVADPDPKPTPPRGFDAVAEAVLGDEPPTVMSGDGGAPPLLAEPLARMNEAVKAGLTDTASELADQTLAQASGTLGPEHPEVLHLRELAAYIAYLAGDPARAFRMSLDLAHVRHQARDAEAAYGNIQSAFTAWRAVRDPLLGLELGHALIGLWTEMTAQDGPATADIEQLEKARTRMGRLTERAQSAR